MPMLRPTALDLDWASPEPALDLMDPGSGSTGANFPGLYLHVISGAGGDIATYIGKSEFLVRERQYEHFEAYYSGRYNIYDAGGAILHVGNFMGLRHPSHDAVMMDQLNRTRVYAARFGSGPANSLLLGAAESLLIQTLLIAGSGCRAINVSPGSQMFRAFDRFTINHHGDPGPQIFFGTTTLWDRGTWTIT